MQLNRYARLRRLDDVIGQGAVIEFLKRQSESTFNERHPARTGRPVILHGAEGAGLSALAELYAKALLCRKAGVPCDRPDCNDCSQFEVRRHPNFIPIRPHQFSDADLVHMISDELRLRPGWKVVLFREAHLISADVFTAVRELFESPNPSTTFIITTHEIERLPRRLVGIFAQLEVLEPDFVDRSRFLERVTKSACIAHEPEALALVAQCAPRGFAPALRDLDELSQANEISVSAVRRYYGLDAVPPVIKYVQAVVEGRTFEEQVRLLDAWPAVAGIKVQSIEGVFASLLPKSLSRWLGLRFEMVDAAVRARIAEGLLAHSAALGWSPRELLEALLDIWKTDCICTRAALLRKASLFDRFMRENGALEPRDKLRRSNILSVKSGSSKGEFQAASQSHLVRAERRALGTESRSAQFLSRVQAKEIWEAGFFLFEKYDLLLNSFISVNYAQLGIGDEVAAANFITRMNLEIRQRLGRRVAKGAPPFPWVYVHEKDASGLSSHIAAHLPENHGDLANWIQKSFIPRQVGPSAVETAIGIEIVIPSEKDYGWPRHLDLLQRLCRGVDPEIEEELRPGGLFIGRRKLADLLKVPKEIRRPIGVLSSIHRYECSRALSRRARQSAAATRHPALNVFTADAFELITSGLELPDVRRRLNQLR